MINDGEGRHAVNGSATAREVTWIIDKVSGELTVEGLKPREVAELAGDLLPAHEAVNCARPINVPPVTSGRKAVTAGAEELLFVFRVYHNSVVEGPGRRSVIQFSGCDLSPKCKGCFVPETHDIMGGIKMGVGEVIRLALDPAGAPRDGVTILGGEPFMQPAGLAALMRRLKREGQHLTLYTGYTVEDLSARCDPMVDEALALADLIIDGPFVAEQADGAGEWRGSLNQRIIQRVSSDAV